MMLILEHTSNSHFLSTKPFEEKLHILLKKGGLDQILFQCVFEQKQKTKSNTNKYTYGGNKEKPTNVLRETLPFQKGPSQALKNQIQLAEGMFICVLT